MVERGGLEHRCGRKPTQGSNPCLSATYTNPEKDVKLQAALKPPTGGTQNSRAKVAARAIAEKTPGYQAPSRIINNKRFTGSIPSELKKDIQSATEFSS